MAVFYEDVKPLIKRVATIADTTEKVQRYDTDNAYPQRTDEIIRRSATLNALMNRIADFVNGEGFADVNLGKIIVNRKGLKGQSLNKVLQEVSHPFVRYRTIPLHIGYNLCGQISSINPLPFHSIRFGIPNKEGKVTKYAYSTNWERDSKRSQEFRLQFYDRFDPNPQTVLAQIEKAGGISRYKGQILYLTPEEGQYPLATFDPVYDDAQVQAEVGIFKLSNIQNNFMPTTAIIYPGEFQTEQEKEEFNALIKGKTGARNAAKRIGLQDKTGLKKASDIFYSLSPVNLDRLFEYTEESVKENIIQSEAFPEILMGKSPSGLFAQGDMEEAYTYVNSITRNRRNELSEVFATLMSYWETPIVTDAKIAEQRYVTDQAVGGGSINVNDNLKNMTGMQAINFQRILRKYGNKLYSREVASSLLMQGFGFSIDEINKLLDSIDKLVLEEAATAPTGAAGTTPAMTAHISLMVKKHL